MVHPLGRRHSHGSVHRNSHQTDPRVDPAELPHPRRNCAYLPGFGEGKSVFIVLFSDDGSSSVTAATIDAQLRDPRQTVENKCLS